MGEEMMRSRSSVLGMLIMGEVVPCMLMATMEALTIGLTILASTVIAKRISPFVFVAYTSALSSLLLLPSFINSDRRRRRHQSEHDDSLLSVPLLARIFLLGLIGVPIAQNLAFLGLSYSSPIVACAMANLIPAISFLLNILLRRTRIDWKSRSNKIKIVGTFISIVGALSTTFYKGPVIRKHSTHLLLAPRLFVFMSPNQRWILGCALFAAASLSFAVWNIVQVETVKLYPDVMKIASSYTLVGTLLTGIVAVVVERDLSAWSLKLDMTLLVIVLTAIFGSVVRSNTQIWCTKLKGPFFVPLFKPFTVPYATFCGCYFFGDTFHYGSIMGAAIVGVGYYTIMWGLTREGDEKSKTLSAADEEEGYEEKVPLLRDEEDSQV